MAAVIVHAHARYLDLPCKMSVAKLREVWGSTSLVGYAQKRWESLGDPHGGIITYVTAAVGLLYIL